jgi:hypothetical protein
MKKDNEMGKRQKVPGKFFPLVSFEFNSMAYILYSWLLAKQMESARNSH